MRKSWVILVSFSTDISYNGYLVFLLQSQLTLLIIDPWFDSSRDLGPIIHELNKIDNSFFHGPSIGIGHSMGGTTL